MYFIRNVSKIKGNLCSVQRLCPIVCVAPKVLKKFLRSPRAFAICVVVGLFVYANKEFWRNFWWNRPQLFENKRNSEQNVRLPEYLSLPIPKLHRFGTKLLPPLLATVRNEKGRLLEAASASDGPTKSLTTVHLNNLERINRMPGEFRTFTSFSIDPLQQRGGVQKALPSDAPRVLQSTRVSTEETESDGGYVRGETKGVHFDDGIERRNDEQKDQSNFRISAYTGSIRGSKTVHLGRKSLTPEDKPDDSIRISSDGEQKKKKPSEQRIGISQFAEPVGRRESSTVDKGLSQWRLRQKNGSQKRQRSQDAEPKKEGFEKSVEIHLSSLELNETEIDSRENNSKINDSHPVPQKTNFDSKLLFYNRIPKCGSSSLLRLLRKLSLKNNFSHLHSKEYDNWRLTSASDQWNLVKNLSLMKERPLSYDRHIFFTDFIRFGYDQPMYINMVRDPIERYVSSFYYAVQQIKQSPEANNKELPSWVNMTLDECFEQHVPTWELFKNKIDSSHMMPFFCGHESYCRIRNCIELLLSILGLHRSLQRAKYNISRYYKVVGVLEEFNKTVNVLQKTLARFFAGSDALIKDSRSFHINKTVKKRPISENLRKKLRKELSLEYELYSFVKKLLNDKFKILNKL